MECKDGRSGDKWEGVYQLNTHFLHRLDIASTEGLDNGGWGGSNIEKYPVVA